MQLVLERPMLHVMGDSRRVALVETKTIDSAAPPATPVPRVRYQLEDHLGSAAMELDEAGLVISYEQPWSMSPRAVMKRFEGRDLRHGK